MADHRSDPQLSRAVIDEVGVGFLMATFCRSQGAISQWRSKGIPSSIMQALRFGFPSLRAFGGAGVKKISK